MKVSPLEQIEKMRIALGAAAIVFVVGLTSAVVTVMGLAQMA